MGLKGQLSISNMIQTDWILVLSYYAEEAPHPTKKQLSFESFFKLEIMIVFLNRRGMTAVHLATTCSWQSY